MSKESDEPRYKVTNAYFVRDRTLEREVCRCTIEGCEPRQFDAETAEYVAAALNYYDAIRPRDTWLSAVELHPGEHFRVAGGSDIVYRVVWSPVSREIYALDEERNSIVLLEDSTRVVRVTGEG